MGLIIDMIIESAIRAVTYAIVISVSTSIRNGIRNSISKKLINKLEYFLDADGEINEEKINSLIKVNVYALGSGLYDVSIQEDVFGVLNLKVISTQDTSHLFKLIKKELIIQKIKAKMRQNDELVSILEIMVKEFK